MILCHCMAVSDRQIRELITQGHQARDIEKLCGAGGRCGSCKSNVEKLCTGLCAEKEKFDGSRQD